MPYQEPEIVVLGQASDVIQGGIPKLIFLEPDSSLANSASDCEFDD